jgi:hypothetical protein
MTVRTYPYRTLRLWTSGDQPVLDVWLGYTPVDAEQKMRHLGRASSAKHRRASKRLDARLGSLEVLSFEMLFVQRHRGNFATANKEKINGRKNR